MRRSSVRKLQSRVRAFLQRYSFYIVLSISGLSGYLIGSIFYPTWQDPVEAGQVLAGIVDYPRDNPYYISTMKIWSLPGQFSGLLLKIGITEARASIIMSGLVAALSFQALATVVYATSRNLIVSAVSTFFIYYMNYAGYGIAYPLWIMGNQPSHGSIGLSFAVLVIGVIASGYYRFGFFLLALSLAVHLPWGLWCWILVASIVLMNYQDFRCHVRGIIIPVLTGLSIAFIGFYHQRYLLPGCGRLPSDIKQHFLMCYINYWDAHRQPFNYLSWCEFLGILGTVVSIAVLTCRKNGQSQERFIPQILLISFILSNILSLASHMPPQMVPSALLMCMPGRYINLNNMLLVPLLLGISGNAKSNLVCKFLFTFFIVFSSLIFIFNVDYKNLLSSTIVEYPPPLPDLPKILLLSLMTGLLSVSLCAARRVTAHALYEKRGTVLVYISALIILGVFSWYLSLFPSKDVIRENAFLQTRDSVIKAASARSGMILVASGLNSIQLFTRRPILLDPNSIDGYIYNPDCFMRVNDILKSLYNVSILAKPPYGGHQGAIPAGVHKRLWESWGVHDWQEKGEEFGISDILVFPDYALRLPVVASNQHMTLYTIPRE